MSGAKNTQQDVDIDLGQLFRAIWRRRTRVLMATVAAAGLAFVAASLISPTYRSETRVLIEQRSPAFAKADTTGGAEQPVLDELNISSQVQVLQSVDLIKQVARNLKLYERPEFDPTSRPSALSDILVAIGLKKNPLDVAPEERVIKEFVDKLQVYQVEKSRVIGIQFTSKDPKLAAEIPNAMADVYQSLQSGAKLDTNSEATRWLEPEIANLREKVRDAEQKIADYRSSSDLLQTSDTTTFAGQQLTDISTELARVRADKANADARAESVRSAISSGMKVDTFSDVVGSQMIQKLKESESSIQAQISDLSTSLMDGHPRLKGLRAQLTDIRSQIDRETQKILASLLNESKVAGVRERQLTQQLNTLKADSARAGESEVGLKALEREAAAQRQLLETYLGRYREAASRADKNSSPADARVISNAVEPREPYFPKVLPIVIVAAIGTFVLSSIIIMLLELFSGRALRPVYASRTDTDAVEKDKVLIVSGPEPVSLKTKAVEPAVAADADLVREMEAAYVHEPTVKVAASVAELSETSPPAVVEHDDYSIPSVAAHLIENKINIAVSISPTGDDGSTATVILAREMAESGRHVLLLDMTGSGFPTRLMAEDASLPGITDLLQGKAAFADTIHSDRLSDAHIIPQGNSDIRQAMRGADRLSMILDALGDAYDHVIVECGPADVGGVARLIRNRKVDLILSVPEPTEELLTEVIGSFEQAGFADLIFMSGLGNGTDGSSGRQVAA